MIGSTRIPDTVSPVPARAYTILMLNWNSKLDVDKKKHRSTQTELIAIGACAKTWTGLWTMDCGLWTMDCGLWTVDCGLWTVDCGLWTVS